MLNTTRQHSLSLPPAEVYNLLLSLIQPLHLAEAEWAEIVVINLVCVFADLTA